MYIIDVAVPGDINPRFMTLSSLLRDEAFAIGDGLEGEAYDEILDSFDKAVATRTLPGLILSTNIFRGMQLTVEHKLGALVAFLGADGQVHRGLLVSKKHRHIRSEEHTFDIPSLMRLSYDLFRLKQKHRL